MVQKNLNEKINNGIIIYDVHMTARFMNRRHKTSKQFQNHSSF